MLNNKSQNTLSIQKYNEKSPYRLFKITILKPRLLHYSDKSIKEITYKK
jgi:hypothetical protein